MFHGHLDYFWKSSLGGRPNTKPGDHGTPNVHNRWFILFYHMWGHTWIEIHWNSIWLKTRSHMTSHYTWGHDHTTWFLEVCWDDLWTLSFGLSQFHGHGSLARVWIGPMALSMWPSWYWLHMVTGFEGSQLPNINIEVKVWNVTGLTSYDDAMSYVLVSTSPLPVFMPSRPSSSRCIIYILWGSWHLWVSVLLLLLWRIPSLGYLLAIGVGVGIYLLVVYKLPSLLTLFTFLLSGWDVQDIDFAIVHHLWHLVSRA